MVQLGAGRGVYSSVRFSEITPSCRRANCTQNSKGHLGRPNMEGATKERWFQLCELAAKEKDPEKLLALVFEINRLLEEKEQRLKSKKPYES
jgi:hypothetical protein